MKLLCIAHRGEAQEFIRHHHLKTSDNRFYQNDNLSLLITGEGPWEVMTRLPYYLAKYNITSMINMGIAGSLDSSLALNTIYELRTLYYHNDTKPKFHSYTTTSDTLIDGITTESRVLTDEFAKDLANFAAIVDREAWAIGKVAHEYKIPFQAYKLISDIAGNSTQCFDLKQRAKEYSEKLLTYFLELEDHQQAKLESTLVFPFKTSFTQQKRLENLFFKLNLYSKLNETILKSNVLELEIKDKAKANKLIDYLENIANPINTKIHAQMKKITSPFEQIGADIFYDSKLEQKKITLKMEINHQQNIDRLIKKLESFKFSAVESVWQGDFDV
ncbi:MAG: hypothetical protein HON90_10520 [Halobacteriovoraceae bacterium]|jgi:nucleoside phosphorylase|nr:hypothetical protein [Halobacteriovoraceae bacterium]